MPHDLLAELTARAQSLAPEERAQLAEALLASLDPHVADVEASWDIELKRRIADVEQGSVALVPIEEGFARVRRSLGA
ncbi:addiction module protein [Hydrogenophaga crocea]|uniref:Addiction module protein n=1 Tax=Hydrogenophaga crocea TaxID=2716225 RepID=A0A6G8IEH9_9BURK|nr:addiction module protein [Hydrogenophaga crocea]QIM51519.1 addiction module protein [Hydrogenophaga crocea]